MGADTQSINYQFVLEVADLMGELCECDDEARAEYLDTKIENMRPSLIEHRLAHMISSVLRGRGLHITTDNPETFEHLHRLADMIGATCVYDGATPWQGALPNDVHMIDLRILPGKPGGHVHGRDRIAR